MQRGRQTENDAALHLRANGVWVHLNTAVNRAPHVGRVDAAIFVHAHLNDLRDEAAEAGAERDAAALSRR